MFSTLITVWFLHVVATITPGANTLFVSQLAASKRSQSAILAALGIATGSVIWALFALLGINAAFQLFPVLRLFLQVAGGSYLVYIAYQLWRLGDIAKNNRVKSVSLFAAFRLGMFTNAINPKAALFFGSIFSISFPLEPSLLLLITTLAIIFINALIWYTLIAYLFSREHVRIVYLYKQRIVDRVAAIIVGGLGIRFLFLSFEESKT